MRRLVFAALLVALSVDAARSGDDVPAPAARPAATTTVAVGGTLTPDLRVLPLARAEEAALLSLGGDAAKPLVVLFWSAKCPVCRRYGAAARALAKDYDGRARLVVVFPNATETEADVRAWIDASSVACAAATDPRQETTSRLAVAVTPTALLIDAAGALRYRGPIDDDRRARRRDSTDLLRAALEAVLAGKPVENAEPRAFGSSVRPRDAGRR